MLSVKIQIESLTIPSKYSSVGALRATIIFRFRSTWPNAVSSVNRHPMLSVENPKMLSYVKKGLLPNMIAEMLSVL